MSETRNATQAERPVMRSQFVTLTVERSEQGTPRLVLDGAYMLSSGFEPGDTIEAIIQPNLISILQLD